MRLGRKQDRDVWPSPRGAPGKGSTHGPAPRTRLFTPLTGLLSALCPLLSLAQAACTVATPDGKTWMSTACIPDSDKPFMLDSCGADGVELQREHEAVNAIFTGSTDIIGGISGPGSNVYVCGVPGWVQTA